MNFSEFTKALENGDFDNQIKMVAELVTSRQKVLAQIKGLELAPKSYVKIVGQIRPAYIRGHIAQVTKVNQSTVNVNFLQPIQGPQRRTPFQNNVNVPLANIEPVDQNEVNKYKEKIKMTPPNRTNRWTENEDQREMDIEARANRWERQQEAREEMEFERRANRY